MLLLGSVCIVLEPADGRLCLDKSFGQTVHALVHGVCICKEGYGFVVVWL